MDPETFPQITNLYDATETFGSQQLPLLRYLKVCLTVVTCVMAL
jgi:hypothetical protein